MERAEALSDISEPLSQGHLQALTRKQKRVLRQKKAKLYKQGALQESSHSEAAEDYALQLAYEQHLHSLQQHHLEASPEQQESQPGWQASKPAQLRSRSTSSKRRRKGCHSTAPAVATVSADTLASSVELAVPVAQPTQRPAQISLLSDGLSLPPQQQQQQQQQQEQQNTPPLHAAAAAVPACAAALAGRQLTALPLLDWSAPAALLSQALMQQHEEEGALPPGAQASAVCRLDLSAAALLIDSQLEPDTLLSTLAQQGQGLQGAAAEADPQAAEVEAAAEVAAAAGSKRRRRVYVHGNYHGYYGYRQSDQRPEDPRLQAFESGWFARRRCLDVGCNEGMVTLALAGRYHPRSMLGVDIDAALVARANRNLREARAAADQRAHLSRLAGVPAEERRQARGAASALAQTSFVHSDFMESEVEGASLDTITCLSVTKWVHLNRGDQGLQALFAAFRRALVPGGLLVLEPQPWSSYRAAACKIRRDQAPPGSFFHRLDELRLRPAQFAEHLCSELGFRLLRSFGVEESAAGFDRPLLLLRKEP